MYVQKPLLIKRDDANIVKTSSGEFIEFISWKENKDLAVGIGIHKKRFPAEGYLISKKVDEIIILNKGSGSIIVRQKDQDQKFVLEKDAIMFIPKGTAFYFMPTPEMEIISATGPAWYPKQQSGLDYKRKETGRMIL